MKDDDYIEHLFVCSTHDYLLFFTNRGKVYRSKVYDLPEARPHVEGPLPRQRAAAARGRAGAVRARDARLLRGATYLMFATRSGTVKKTEFQAYNTPIKADGIIAINIRDDDELVAVRRVDEGDEILMVSHAGLTVRFREEDARAMGRDTSGVRGMDVAGKDNDVLAMDVARPGQDLLVVTENGFGKRTPIDEYRKTSAAPRASRRSQLHRGQGRCWPARWSSREHQELVFISQNGMVQRTARARHQPLRPHAQGVRLMNAARGRPGVARSRWWSSPRPRRAADGAGDARRRAVDGRRSTSRARRTTPTARRRPARPTRGRRRRSTPPEVDADDVEPSDSRRPRGSVLWIDQRKGVVRS